jgi:DNA-binding transcriptional regulator YdaS (Cro superfamily)
MARNENPVIASALADQLGLIKAQIAQLKEQEQSITQELIATGEKEIEGTTFRVAISLVEPSKQVDWKAVAQKLKPSHQLITANTGWKAGYVAVRVSARKVD